QVEDLPATQIAERVLDGTLDLGLAFTMSESAGLKTEPLFSERLVLLVGKDHPLANQKSVQGRNLSKLKIALQSKQYASRQLIDRHLRLYVQDGVCMELDSLQTMQLMVAKSDLVCILFEGAVLPLADLRAIPITTP